MIWGPWIFEFVFGSDWTMAGEYARWVAIWVFTDFIKPPSNRAILVLNLQHMMLLIHLVTFFMRIIAFLIGAVIFDSVLLALGGLAVVGVIHNFAGILLAIFNCNK